MKNDKKTRAAAHDELCRQILQEVGHGLRRATQLLPLVGLSAEVLAKSSTGNRTVQRMINRLEKAQEELLGKGLIVNMALSRSSPRIFALGRVHLQRLLEQARAEVRAAHGVEAGLRAQITNLTIAKEIGEERKLMERTWLLSRIADLEELARQHIEDKVHRRHASSSETKQMEEALRSGHALAKLETQNEVQGKDTEEQGPFQKNPWMWMALAGGATLYGMMPSIMEATRQARHFPHVPKR